MIDKETKNLLDSAILAYRYFSNHKVPTEKSIEAHVNLFQAIVDFKRAKYMD